MLCIHFFNLNHVLRGIVKRILRLFCDSLGIISCVPWLLWFPRSPVFRKNAQTSSQEPHCLWNRLGKTEGLDFLTVEGFIVNAPVASPAQPHLLVKYKYWCLLSSHVVYRKSGLSGRAGQTVRGSQTPLSADFGLQFYFHRVFVWFMSHFYYICKHASFYTVGHARKRN